jgi:hypothetical protein
MKARGAWTWWGKLNDGTPFSTIGSQCPITYLVRCKTLEVDRDEFASTSVDPSLEDMRRLTSEDLP